MLKTFFEKFDQLTDLPESVTKIRALIVDLAVEGKLVPNNPSEKPIELKMSGTLNSILRVSANWQVGNVGDVLSFEYGNNLPAPKRDTLGKYPVYGSNGIVGTHSECLCREPAIIVGRKGSAGALNISAGPSWTTDVAYFVRPPKEIDLRFAYYLLQSLHLDELGKGIKPGLSRKEVYALPVAIPPLAEQKRIVSKIDELMVLCDRLEAQQKERTTRYTALAHAATARFSETPTVANLNLLFHKSYSIVPTDLRKMILNLALQGKLVVSESESGLASSAFTEVRATTRDVSGLLPIPKSWFWAEYRNITSLVTSGSRGWKEFYSKSGSIFVRTQNIKTDRLVLDDVAYVQLPVSAEGVRTRINKDDILITITGANVTKAARIEEEIPEAYVSQHIALTRPLWHEMSPWLHLCFLAPAGARGKLEELAYGDKPGLNLSNIRNLVLPIPPLLEQRKIIARVNQLMGMVDRLEAQLTTCAVKGQELLVAFMHNLLHSNEKYDPGVSEDYASNRASIGCYVMNHLLHNPNFGRTMLMKVFYLSEAHAGISQGWEPMRQAAGPYDPAIEDFESLGIQSGWFSLEKKTLSNGHEMVEYQGKSGMEAKIAEAVSVLGGRQTEFDRLLNLFQRKTTEEAEIIATLFAAWNDLLIDGKSPSDDEIIREVRENWHYKKERFTPTLLTRWLNWLRQQSVIPRGLAPRTRQQLKLGLS